MDERCLCCEDSDGQAAAAVAAAEHYTLVIDTSLGTRLLTTIATSASVSDAKRKIELDHFQVYPNKGEIRILQLKVEHQGSLYCLQDSMPLAGAYEESTPFKPLFVEASSIEHDAQVGAAEPVVQMSNISAGRNAVNATTGANEAMNHSDPVANHSALLSGGTKKKKRARK